MLDNMDFDKPHIYALAETAYMFGECDLIKRCDTIALGNPTVLAKHASRVKQSSKNDPRPDEHIVLNPHAGAYGDTEGKMSNLVDEPVQIGRFHRPATRAFSREGYHEAVFKWAMGPLDWRLPLERLVVRRAIDAVKNSVLKTSYGTLVVVNQRVPLKSGAARKWCKESIDCLLSQILSRNIPCHRTLYEIVT